MRQQIMHTDGDAQRPQDFTDSTRFWLNHRFAVVNKTGRAQARGRVNIIGRQQLQVRSVLRGRLSQSPRLQIAGGNREQALHEEIVQLRALRVQVR